MHVIYSKYNEIRSLHIFCEELLESSWRYRRVPCVAAEVQNGARLNFWREPARLGPMGPEYVSAQTIGPTQIALYTDLNFNSIIHIQFTAATLMFPWLRAPVV